MVQVVGIDEIGKFLNKFSVLQYCGVAKDCYDFIRENVWLCHQPHALRAHLFSRDVVGVVGRVDAAVGIRA